MNKHDFNYLQIPYDIEHMNKDQLKTSLKTACEIIKSLSNDNEKMSTKIKNINIIMNNGSVK